MIGRILIYGSALFFLCRGQGTGRLFQVYRQTMAMRRCVRMLSRSEAARQRGDRAAAERWLVANGRGFQSMPKSTVPSLIRRLDTELQLRPEQHGAIVSPNLNDHVSLLSIGQTVAVYLRQCLDSGVAGGTVVGVVHAHVIEREPVAVNHVEEVVGHRPLLLRQASL